MLLLCDGKKEVVSETNNSTTTTSVALLACVEAVISNQLGSKVKNVDRSFLAKMMVEEWQTNGTVVCPRLRLFVEQNDTIIGIAHLKKIESMVLQKIQRHVLLSHFNKQHWRAFNHEKLNFGYTYDSIVREVNSSYQGTVVLDYPRLPGPAIIKDMDKAEVQAIKTKRYEVEQVIKLWFNQLRQHEKRRLPEFTSDEAWLEILRAWSTGDDYFSFECNITPSLAPDTHWKFLYMKRYQRENHRTKHFLKYCPELEEWSDWYWEFVDDLKSIARENGEKIPKMCWNRPTTFYNHYNNRGGGGGDSYFGSSWYV